MIKSVLKVVLACGVSLGFAFLALSVIYAGRDWCGVQLSTAICRPMFAALAGGVVFAAAYLPMSEIKKAIENRRSRKGR